jgi:uncharacterized protein (TIGR02594 family)
MKTPYQIALEELKAGVKEVPGPGNNPRIIEYFQHTSGKFRQDSVSWCAAFINFCIEKAGLKGTNSAAARSFTHWGDKTTKPQVGDIAVLRRTSDPSKGHVGFLAEKPGPIWIKLLGGNQQDKVCVEKYLRARVITYRRPPVK